MPYFVATDRLPKFDRKWFFSKLINDELALLFLNFYVGSDNNIDVFIDGNVYIFDISVKYDWVDNTYSLSQGDIYSIYSYIYQESYEEFDFFDLSGLPFFSFNNVPLVLTKLFVFSNDELSDDERENIINKFNDNLLSKNYLYCYYFREDYYQYIEHNPICNKHSCIRMYYKRDTDQVNEFNTEYICQGKEDCVGFAVGSDTAIKNFHDYYSYGYLYFYFPFTVICMADKINGSVFLCITDSNIKMYDKSYQCDGFVNSYTEYFLSDFECEDIVIYNENPHYMYSWCGYDLYDDWFSKPSDNALDIDSGYTFLDSKIVFCYSLESDKCDCDAYFDEIEEYGGTYYDWIVVWSEIYDMGQFLLKDGYISKYSHMDTHAIDKYISVMSNIQIYDCYLDTNMQYYDTINYDSDKSYDQNEKYTFDDSSFIDLFRTFYYNICGYD